MITESPSIPTVKMILRNNGTCINLSYSTHVTTMLSQQRLTFKKKSTPDKKSIEVQHKQKESTTSRTTQG
jgi:hypothetical protein